MKAQYIQGIVKNINLLENKEIQNNKGTTLINEIQNQESQLNTIFNHRSKNKGFIDNLGN